MTYEHNTKCKLLRAIVPARSSTGVEGTHTYQYDALGRRVRKTTGGAGAADTVFVRDGQTVIAEYAATQAAASPLRKYVNASYVDEPVLLIDRTAAGSVGAGTDERFYYHRNQQYSITALTDNSGAVVERYAYTAYGEPTILDGAGTTTRTTSFIGNPYLYTAQEYDAESGLYHFNARMYEGRKGRFLSHDPIMYPDGYNTYIGWFAVAGTDPSGEVRIRCGRDCGAMGKHYGVPAELIVDCSSGNPDQCCRNAINSRNGRGWYCGYTGEWSLLTQSQPDPRPDYRGLCGCKTEYARFVMYATPCFALAPVELSACKPPIGSPITCLAAILAVGPTTDWMCTEALKAYETLDRCIWSKK